MVPQAQDICQVPRTQRWFTTWIVHRRVPFSRDHNNIHKIVWLHESPQVHDCAKDTSKSSNGYKFALNAIYHLYLVVSVSQGSSQTKNSIVDKYKGQKFRICKKKFLICSFGITSPAREPPHVIKRKLPHHSTGAGWKKEKSVLTLTNTEYIRLVPG